MTSVTKMSSAWKVAHPQGAPGASAPQLWLQHLPQGTSCRQGTSQEHSDIRQGTEKSDRGKKIGCMPATGRVARSPAVGRPR